MELFVQRLHSVEFVEDEYPVIRLILTTTMKRKDFVVGFVLVAMFSWDFMNRFSRILDLVRRLRSILVEIPQSKIAWLSDFRVGKVENIYGTFDCEEPDCVCEFLNLADLVIHSVVGKHGSLGDRISEEHRRKFKYFSRQRRYKERQYASQSEESEQQETSVQETLK